MELRIKQTGEVLFESEWRQRLLQTGGPSFDALTDEICELLGVEKVFEGPQPAPATPYQRVERSGVEQIGNLWYTKYVLREPYTTPEEEAEFKARIDSEQTSGVRKSRNKLLSECDWTQVADAPVDKQAWATYRQALRDITNQPGFPWDLTWPEPPQGTA